ncbi:MAG: rhombosortase [Chromatiales bacterium 21-64-14]|nr:MAG: rhombosortase [Chromatiales bacterium 21-64-14]HQU15958.1 rhombosortase [Gammaproteobacteria bacterium]
MEDRPGPLGEGVTRCSGGPRWGTVHTLAGALFPLSLVVLTVVLQWFAPWTTDGLRYDRNGILHGQWWRLITGNFVHLNWPHLALNLLGLIFIWVLLAREWSPLRWLVSVLLCSLSVGLGLLMFDPRLDWYVGLSGVLHGLFAIGLVTDDTLQGLERYGLLGALLLKIGWEQFHGATPGVAEMIGSAVVVQAHLYGAVAGLLVGGVMRVGGGRMRPMGSGNGT